VVDIGLVKDLIKVYYVHAMRQTSLEQGSITFKSQELHFLPLRVFKTVLGLNSNQISLVLNFHRNFHQNILKLGLS
jgi:hypothetical protein